MKKGKISPEFRSHLSEKLMDLGNLSIAALVLGQFVSGKEVSLTLLLFGTVCYYGYLLYNKLYCRW